MSQPKKIPKFVGDLPAAAKSGGLNDRREIALVAMERTRTPMVVADAQHPDHPIILANQAFLDLTGFSPEEIIGRNCRFLQGKDTSKTAIGELRRALARGDDHIEMDLINYRKDGTSFLNALLISAIRDDNGRLLYYFASQEDVTVQRRAGELEANEKRLLKEVDHRTLNALALIQSIVTLSRANDAENLFQSINGRINALGITHRLLADRHWKPVSLVDLINQQLQSNGILDRVVVDQPAVELVPEIVQPLGLVIHELLTNALIHGALSRDEELIKLECNVEGKTLMLRWMEPAAFGDLTSFNEGFGLQIVYSVVEHQLGGRRIFRVMNDMLEVTFIIPHAVYVAD